MKEFVISIVIAILIALILFAWLVKEANEYGANTYVTSYKEEVK